jgi:hypothetical protein
MQLQIILSLDVTSMHYTDYKGTINQSDAFNLAD